MIQGTASNVGKSVITTALCRILKRRGYRVAPFKAQNMANNSSVTLEGGEIGTAQAVQAQACGLQPSTWMNPILLKPNSDTTSQVVVLGKVLATLTAKEYQHKKKDLISCVAEALHQLRRAFDIVVIEGAGSPAEINLKHHDLVNMAVAKSVSSPVILVGDIDRGGVFAQIVGTFELLDSREKELTRAFIINKFRGDQEILKPGIEWIEKKIERKSLGVLPMMRNLNIKQEDAVVLEESKILRGHSSPPHPACPGWQARDGCGGSQKLLIHVIRLPRISNFTDFEPLARERGVILEYVQEPDRHRFPDLLIIPGTKNTVADLDFLKRSGFTEYIKRSWHAGVCILGICGGYQMLGVRIDDPDHIESSRSSVAALGLLPTVTRFSSQKTTVAVKAVHLESQLAVAGYEIHMGQTSGLNGKDRPFDSFASLTRSGFRLHRFASSRERRSLSGIKSPKSLCDFRGQSEAVGAPFLKIMERQGHRSDDYDGYCLFHKNGSRKPSFVIGTYLHGLFDNAPFRRYFLNRLRSLSGLAIPKDKEHPVLTPDKDYDHLADEVEKNIDMKFLAEILGERFV